MAVLWTLPHPGHAAPPNPDRPLEAETCSAAQARLAEAQDGSPLLSQEEQAEVLRVALENVARLCDAGQMEDAEEGQVQPSLAPNGAVFVRPVRSKHIF